MKTQRMLRPSDAATVLGSNAESVRIRMQRGSFDPPIGTACAGGQYKYTYEIYPEKLAAYLNISVKELWQRLTGE